MSLTRSKAIWIYTASFAGEGQVAERCCGLVNSGLLEKLCGIIWASLNLYKLRKLQKLKGIVGWCHYNVNHETDRNLWNTDGCGLNNRTRKEKEWIAWGWLEGCLPRGQITPPLRVSLFCNVWYNLSVLLWKVNDIRCLQTACIQEVARYSLLSFFIRSRNLLLLFYYLPWDWKVFRVAGRKNEFLGPASEAFFFFFFFFFWNPEMLTVALWQGGWQVGGVQSKDQTLLLLLPNTSLTLGCRSFITSLGPHFLK